jgi:hypothetical protein
MWDLWLTKWHWGRISSSTSVSPANPHSTNCSIIIDIFIRGWYNRPTVADVPSGLSLTPPRETKLNYLGTRWRWMVSFTPLSLYPQGNSPLYRGLAGPRNLSERCGEEKNVIPLSGIDPRLFARRAHSLVAIPTALYRLVLRWRNSLKEELRWIKKNN